MLLALFLICGTAYFLKACLEFDKRIAALVLVLLLVLWIATATGGLPADLPRLR